jgi:lysophospholipase L1-like esterase
VSTILSPSDFKRYSGYTCCLLGDSITNAHNYRITVSRVTQANGIATVVTTAAHELWPGAEFTFYVPAGVEPEFAGKRRVATRVDSTTFTFACSPDAPAVARTITGIRHEGHYSDQGWFHWANSRLHGRFQILNNVAVSGARTEHLAKLVETEVIAYKPQFCFVLSGTNDVMANIPLTRITSNLERIYRQLSEAGIVVVALTVPPMDSGASEFTPSSPRIRRINHWIREYARQNPSIILVDTYAALIDSTSTTGAAASTMLGDGIHPTVVGAKAMGDAIAEVLQDFMPPCREGLMCPFDAYGISATTVTLSRTANLATATATAHGFAPGDEILVTGATPADMNGLFTILTTQTDTFTFHAPGANGSGSGTIKAGTHPNMYDYGLMHVTTGGTVTAPVTGTAATGMEIVRLGSAAAVASVVAAPTAWHPDGISVGNAQRVVITPAGASDSVRIQSATAQLANRIIAGRNYYFELYASFTGVSGSNLEGILCYLSFTVDSVVYNVYAHRRSLTTYPTSDFVLCMRSPVFKVPPGTISLRFWRLEPEFSGAGTALTIDVGRVRVVQVD